MSDPGDTGPHPPRCDTRESIMEDRDLSGDSESDAETGEQSSDCAEFSIVGRDCEDDADDLVIVDDGDRDSVEEEDEDMDVNVSGNNSDEEFSFIDTDRDCVDTTADDAEADTVTVDSGSLTAGGRARTEHGDRDTASDDVRRTLECGDTDTASASGEVQRTPECDDTETDSGQRTLECDDADGASDQIQRTLECGDTDSDSGQIQRTLDVYVNGGPTSTRRRRAFYKQKVRRVERMVRQSPVDMAELRQQAISHGGLLSADLRRQVWPLLLNVDPHNIPPKPEEAVLKGHRDYEQVVMDVNRSIKRFPPGMEEDHRLSLQDKLVDVIMRVLVRHPELHYYQGFHDICVTFLLVVDEDLAFALVEKLSLSHLRDFLEPTMERTQQLLDYVPPLLRRANPELLHYMEGAELGNVFCISWLLTWFGHVLNDIESILRIFDFFIACHPLMPVYVMGAVVLHREREILSTVQEMPALYQLLTKIPDNLPFEHLLSNAGDLYLQYPPTELANEAVQRFRRAQEQAAARKAMLLSRRQARERPSLLPDGNLTFSKVTFWMLGAVVSVAAYALLAGIDWDWISAS